MGSTLRLFTHRPPPAPRVLLTLIVASSILLLMPTVAQAHGRIPGAGDVLNGVLHPLRTPVHIFVIVALSLLLAHQTPRRLLPSMIAFAGSSGIGLVLVNWIAPDGLSPLIPLVLAMAIAALVALAIPLPVWARATLCAVAGAVLGLDSAFDTDATLTLVKMSLGTWIILSVLVCDLAFYASFAQKHWLEIGRRILASWIIAIALMMLAFTLAPPSS